MARDEKERDRTRQDVRGTDSPTEIEATGKKVSTTKPAAESARLTRLAKPKSLYLTGWNTGSQSASSSSISARPRIAPSTERMARPFRISSAGPDKTIGQERLQTLKLKAPLPAGWKPTPTKTSILREAAMQAAKDAKLRSAFVKPSRNESPVRGTPASLARSRASRSVTASPEKVRQHAVQEASRSVRGRDEATLSLPSRQQEAEDSPFGNRKKKSIAVDPIFALPSPFGVARRLQNLSDESYQSSEWSVDTASQGVRRRSHTPQYPSIEQNEDFSPFHESLLDSSPAKGNNASPSHRQYPGLTPSPKHKNQISTRLLLNSPVHLEANDLPFEKFESDDDYLHQSPHKSPTRSDQKSATSLDVHRDPLHYATSPRARQAVRVDSSDDLGSSKMRPILTVGRGQQRRQHESGSRDSIKSVRWDPAIVAVGRCIAGTHADGSDQPGVMQSPPQDSNDPLDLAMDNYLDSVTQSFAKLKKSNPKVITKLLAALRDLSDDESNTDSEQRKKLRLKSKPASSTPSTDLIARKLAEVETIAAEQLRPSEQCSQIQDKPASVIEKMQSDQSTDRHDGIDHAKVDSRWGEAYPYAAHLNKAKVDSMSKTLVSDSDSIRISIRACSPPPDYFLNSPAWIPAREEDVGRLKQPALGLPKLNPMAPAFRDLSVLKDISTTKSKASSPGRQNSPQSKNAKHNNDIPEQSHSGPGPRGLTWRNTTRPEEPANTLPSETVLPSIEPIWINTSQLLKTGTTLDAAKDRVSSKEMPASESAVDNASTFTQPQIFTVPPGFIPLIPHPGFLSHMTPYQPAYPQPTGLSTSVTAVPSTITHSCDQMPSEDEPGRESLLLEAEWSYNLLRTFQAKYPLTGTRATSTEIAAATAAATAKVESAKPCLVTPPVVGAVSTSEQPSVQPAEFQPRTRRPFVKKSGASLQQLAKKTRASVIQQALEVKIFQFKEKKAAETREIQKKQIERVERILPLVRQKMQIKSKFANENAPPQDFDIPLQIWQRAPHVSQRAMNNLLEDPEATSARHLESGSLAHEQGAKDMDLVDYDELSHSFSSTVVANYDMNLPAKPWQRNPLNTQPSNINRDRLERLSPADQKQHKLLHSMLTKGRSGKENGPGPKRIGNQKTDASVEIPYHASGHTNTGLGPGGADPWELLTAKQWENQLPGNHSAANSHPQVSEAGSDVPFKAPKYLWDFLDLEFKLDDLQNLSSLARASSRSSSGAASDALTDALMDARSRLSLSQSKSKGRGGREQNISEASTATAVSGYSMDSAGTANQEVQLNFDWVPHRLLSRSTVDISSDSDYLEMAPSKKSKLQKPGRLMALVEGSAVEDAYSSKNLAGRAM